MLQKQAELDDENNNGSADAGEQIQYSFVIINNGNVTVNDPRVTDELAGDVTCEAESLAPRDTLTCTADEPYTVTQDDVNNGSVHNVAVGHATPVGEDDEIDSNPAENDTPTVPHAALINVNKTATLHDENDNGASLGEVIDYEFEVTNLGNVPLTDITVVDEFLGAVDCPESTLPPLESMTCTASHTVTQANLDMGGGSIYNVATAIGTPPSDEPVTSEPSDEVVPIELPQPRLSLEKHAELDDTNGNDLADEGETIGYTFTVSNTGNQTIRDLRIDDQLIGAVTCPAGSLAPGIEVTCTADAAYTTTAADVEAGRVHNVATARGWAPPGSVHDVESDPATATVETGAAEPEPTPPPEETPPPDDTPPPQPTPPPDEKPPYDDGPDLPETGLGLGLEIAALVGLVSLLTGVATLITARRRAG